MADVIHKCDVCDDEETSTAEDELPEGWIELTLRDSEDNEALAVLCSFECGGEWLDNMSGDEGEDDEDE